MKLYLCRHGNTFDKGNKVVWVGKHEDLALTEKGQQQAHTMATQIQADGVKPVFYVAAHLKRTQVYAEIIRQDIEWDVPLMIDPRLAEVDYGDWGGKTTEEINEQFGEESLALWNSESKVPENCGWGETEAEISTRLKAAFAETQKQFDAIKKSNDDVAVMVTSNGIIRLLLEMFDPEQYAEKKANGTLKVPTGGYVTVRAKS